MENILKDIYKAGLKFLVPLTAEETYKTIVHEGIKLVGAEYGSILLEREGHLERVYASLPFAYQTKIRKRGNTYRAFRTRKTIMASISKIEKAHPELKAFGIRWSVFIPLSYIGKAIGVLTVNSRRDEEFNRKSLEVLEHFGSMASLAIRKTQLHDETKKALETRDLFISVAAHELRTPVTTIHGYAQLLYQKTENKQNSEARWIGELHAESARLALLVNDLLEISRIKTGKLQYHYKECSLLELAERAVKNFQFNHPKREIIYVNDLGKLPDLIIGDFDKLLQVFSNLLDNAAKFSDLNDKITIILKAKLNNLIIQVIDHGKGISKRDLPKVFEGYYRGQNNGVEGMGLGLFLCKNIIEKHHGSIHLHSKVNKGTVVEVQLPRAKI